MDADTRALIDALRRTSHPIDRSQRMQAADAIERIYAAGFEAAKEMAAGVSETLHQEPLWDHDHQIAEWYGASVAAAIRSLHPQEPSHVE